MSRHLPSRPSSIWQPTYFTLPPIGWKGPTVLIVADLIYEMFPDALPSWGDKFFRRQKRRCIETADVIICISDTTKTDLLDVFDLKDVPIHVVHLAASDVYRNVPLEAADPDAPPFFLYVGGRDSYKNFRVVLDALAMSQSPSAVELVVAGPPFSKSELGEIERRRLIDVVQHVGRPSERELAVLYSRARGFIYPSLYEGFGIPLVEAMTRGCPVVASDIPSNHEVAAEFAFYFEPRDAGALAVQLQQLVNHPPPANQGALERSRQFSWARTAREMYDIYSSL